jgi:hypothetical protein
MLVYAFLSAQLHARPRVQRAPGLSCALGFFWDNEDARLGQNMSRDRESMSSYDG